MDKTTDSHPASMCEDSTSRPVLVINPGANAKEIAEAVTDILGDAEAALVILAAALDSASGPPSPEVAGSFLWSIQRQLSLVKRLAAYSNGLRAT